MASKTREKAAVCPRATQLESRRRWAEEWIAPREIRRNARVRDRIVVERPGWFEDLVRAPFTPPPGVDER